MPIDLPKPIADYVEANAGLDVDGMLKPFLQDAVFIDNGKHFEGHAAIRELLEEEVVPVKAIFVPSGDQLGTRSLARLALTLVWSEPSVFITYIWAWPSLREKKAILEPSGDQEGASSTPAELLVTLVWLEPSAFMT